jgi:phage terminase small subunit
MCELADLAEGLRAEIKERGVSYESRGRWYSNPACAALADAQRALANGMTNFGLTPASRGKLGVAEPATEPTKMELLMMRREAREAAAARVAAARPSPPAGSSPSAS